MNSFRLYLKEVKYLNIYIIVALMAIILSYSVYAIFDVETVAQLGREDRFFEWMTSLSFLIASFLFGILFFKTRSIFYLVFAILFFIGFGEEISWGQRLLGFKTPESLSTRNVQGEFNIHNIELLNRETMEGETRTGLSRFLEINLLFKIFTVLISLIIPIAVFHIRAISRVVRRIKLPVPPVTIAVLFSVNWIVFKLVLDFFSLPGQIFQYYDTDTEIYEFVSAFIILVLAFYFYNKRNEVAPGEDVKEFLIAHNRV